MVRCMVILHHETHILGNIDGMETGARAKASAGPGSASGGKDLDSKRVRTGGIRPLRAAGFCPKQGIAGALFAEPQAAAHPDRSQRLPEPGYLACQHPADLRRGPTLPRGADFVEVFLRGVSVRLDMRLGILARSWPVGAGFCGGKSPSGVVAPNGV